MQNEERSKRKILYICITVPVLMLIFVVVSLCRSALMYEKAKKQLNSGEYKAAAETLFCLNKKRLPLTWDMYKEYTEKNPGKERNNYPRGVFGGYELTYCMEIYERKGHYAWDSDVLYVYALSRMEYEGEKNMNNVNYYMNYIPEGYSGYAAGEISAFREQAKADYEVYEQIQTQKRMEAERKTVAELAKKLPYVNMSEIYIAKTKMGKPDGSYPYYKKNSKVYYWDADEGYMMLSVICENGTVTDVKKHAPGYYWTSDGEPNPSGKDPEAARYWSQYHDYIRSNGNDYDDDGYDVDDYADAEEFYEDFRDDFTDYEDAEDYYLDHTE